MKREPQIDDLLAGPRGRRLLLEYAMAVEEQKAQWQLSRAVRAAARAFEPAGTMIWIGDGPPAEPETISPAEAAHVLAQVTFAEPSQAPARSALARSIDMARYWQEPDGEDQLAATPEMRDALQRVAVHLAPAFSSWWWPMLREAQWAVQWDDEGIAAPRAISAEELRQHRARMIEGEQQAQRDGPVDPAANMSGDWWSMPAWLAPSTAGETFDGSPAALWFVEDGLGWERGFAHRATIAPDARVFEIDGPQAWADLCRRFPLVVTASRRHDWYRTTGRVGEWVIPDWASVAQHYDAVHLQTGAYLAVAGTAIEVGDGRASVIAGWNPDETYWLTSAVQFDEPPQTWVSPDGQNEEWGHE
ncbi:hypothetical protein IM711_05730 [Microbacterium esteraromaticum]|uniref:hypothetical protein n=1 Tax=Microbacterium esteraromaticum TaxID=57043 RepID=UPI003C2D24D2